MTVEKADVIDLAVQNPKTKEVQLVMVEVRDWRATPEAVGQLRAKFRLYAEYILAGALARQFPEMANRPLSIRLNHFAPINDGVAGILREWAGRLSGVQVCSQRLFWNPVLNFFHGLAARLLGRDVGIVRWTAEPGSAQPIISQSQFTQEFTAALRQAVPEAQIVVVGDLELRIKTPDAMDQQAFLANAYNHYMLAPENKDDIIRKFATSMGEWSTLDAGGTDKSRLVPVLKDKGWLNDVNQTLKDRGTGNGVGSVHEPYNDELTIVYAEDTPTNVRYLTSEDFAELKMDMADLRSLACANLQRLLGEPDVQEDDGIYRIKAGGDYDACVLLLEDFWAHAELPVDGELVAAVPARDFLAVTGTKNTKAVAKLKGAAQAIASQVPYRLTPTLFVRRGGRFVGYEG